MKSADANHDGTARVLAASHADEFLPHTHTHTRSNTPEHWNAGWHAPFRYADATDMTQKHTNKQDMVLVVGFYR